ncbi:hypothetical protein MRX96_012673 [Rhipicephalus microplus]
MGAATGVDDREYLQQPERPPRRVVPRQETTESTTPTTSTSTQSTTQPTTTTTVTQETTTITTTMTEEPSTSRSTRRHRRSHREEPDTTTYGIADEPNVETVRVVEPDQKPPRRARLRCVRGRHEEGQRPVGLRMSLPAQPALHRVPAVARVRAAASDRNSTSSPTVKCPRGEDECHGSMVQTCVMRHVEETLTAVRVIACMSRYPDPHHVGRLCVEKYGLEWHLVDKCVTEQGKLLMLDMGKQTWSITGSVNSVPLIRVQGEMSHVIQGALTGNDTETTEAPSRTTSAAAPSAGY